MPTPESILSLLSEITETEEVRRNPDLALYDLQILDSMRTVELLIAVSRDLGIEISPAEFDRDAWATPQKFVDDILSRSALSR
jgi:D-alanine--poly(phosphoribitol) ligase subunit 2